jgi:protein FRG1
MVKALTFKGDKKVKKRKRVVDPDDPENPSSKALTTTSGAPTASEDDDSWVTADVPNDVSGPVLIVLPTEPATCLACDANGKVYASAIENFVDGDPTTAEPHDVRQVFVANRVAGTESISLKGHHGRYATLNLYTCSIANIGMQISRLR